MTETFVVPDAHGNGSLVRVLLWVGPISEGHHRCGNGSCIYPNHLEALSARAHVLDRHGEQPLQAIVGAREVRRQEQRSLTHCVNGHEFTPENTYVRKEGWRMCRACLADRQRARRAAC